MFHDAPKMSGSDRITRNPAEEKNEDCITFLMIHFYEVVGTVLFYNVRLYNCMYHVHLYARQLPNIYYATENLEEFGGDVVMLVERWAPYYRSLQLSF